MTITTESTNKEIQCFYDSQADKDYFELTLETKHGCIAMNFINTQNIQEIIDTLKYFKEILSLTARR